MDDLTGFLHVGLWGRVKDIENKMLVLIAPHNLAI